MTINAMIVRSNHLPNKGIASQRDKREKWEKRGGVEGCGQRALLINREKVEAEMNYWLSAHG